MIGTDIEKEGTRFDGKYYIKLLLSGKTQKTIKILPEAP